jgi:acyl-coenzyme A synthetase/AMP-(fatty) acid ligase
LELALSKSPYVKESVVIGIPNKEKNDYDTVAILQPDIPYMISVYGKDYTEEQLDLEMKRAISEANATVAAYKRIHSHILRTEDFPKNTSGKIRRDPVLAEYIKEDS